MEKLTANDKAWEKIFNQTDLLEEVTQNGFYTITANNIKAIGQREPRLMTKFDHQSQLPKLFSDNGLSILPISRGSYIIGRFKAYENMQLAPQAPIKKQLPNYIESFDLNNITSESIALNIAHASGMIDTLLESDNNSSRLTLAGRMSSRNIDFRIKSKNSKEPLNINVNNAQVEIDGSYESPHKVALIEAKNRTPKDFLVRQLYYPYRIYKQRNISKEILPIFFTYADEIFSFHIYNFTNEEEYSSIKKIDQMDFILGKDLTISLEQILYISKNVYFVDEIDIFPQADDFLRVLDLLKLLKESSQTKQSVATYYKFDERQADYYFNSLKYLGLAKREKHFYSLTSLGRQIACMDNSKERNVLIIEQILAHKPFNLAFHHYLEYDKELDSEYIKKLLIKEAFNINSDSTAIRRKSTVRSWIQWIFSHTHSS
jgi:hypothetical protein